MTKNGFTNSKNPWLSISATDYEGHMDSEMVGQLSVLNSIFESALRDTNPKSLAVLGCGTGNGFEHIDPQIVGTVLGIDINPEYLSVLRTRYEARLQKLELMCADLNAFVVTDDTFDLIYAALIFEYVDFESLLGRISKLLKSNGTLAIVLQLPSHESKMISDTHFTSLKALNSIMHLINPETFDATAARCGLKKTKDMEIPLKQGKRFLVSYYSKVKYETESSRSGSGIIA